jgi:hypothetical protein
MDDIVLLGWYPDRSLIGSPGHGVKLPHIGALHGAPGAVPQPALPVCFAPFIVSSYSSRVCVVIGKQPVQHGLGSAIAMC